MLVYGHRSFTLELPAFLQQFTRRLESLPVAVPHDAIVDLLVDFAEAESAFADALSPDRDDEVDALIPWRAALDALTAAACASLESNRRAVGLRLATLARLAQTLPTAGRATVAARVAEGFSCYALYPDQYVDAAARLDVRPHETVVCLGLRSIGAVLASLVASSLRARGVLAETRSVRPRGHPFDRRLELGPALERFLDEHRLSRFVIVDEGPGLSGSSFAAAAEALAAHGVPDDRIVLMAAWRPDPCELNSERGRGAIRRHRIVVGRSPSERLARRRAHGATGGATPGDVENVSAGEWRSLVYDDAERWPAVHPQHERVKFLAPASLLRGRRTTPDGTIVIRFAGLGRHGAAKLARARVLHEAGFVPAPIALQNGLIVEQWQEGPRLARGQALAADALDRIGRYISFLRRAFPLDEEDDGGDLREMLRQNAREGLGTDAADALRLADAEWPRSARIAVDGRMLPHEWIVSRGQLTKADALDHHADDFLPGCRDAAWDLAGACVEFDLGPQAREYLVQRYTRHSGDLEIRRRLPFFVATYLAYRLGYSSLAAAALDGTPDGDRFRRLREGYRRSLAAHAARSRQTAPR